MKLNSDYGCLPNFYGPSCIQCDCPDNAVCDDGITGNGTCSCKPLFQGENCDTCVGGYYPSKDSCNPCAKGTYGVNGTCIPCDAGTFSANIGQTEVIQYD